MSEASQGSAGHPHFRPDGFILWPPQVWQFSNMTHRTQDSAVFFLLQFYYKGYIHGKIWESTGHTASQPLWNQEASFSWCGLVFTNQQAPVASKLTLQSYSDQNSMLTHTQTFTPIE